MFSLVHTMYLTMLKLQNISIDICNSENVTKNYNPETAIPDITTDIQVCFKMFIISDKTY